MLNNENHQTQETQMDRSDAPEQKKEEDPEPSLNEVVLPPKAPENSTFEDPKHSPLPEPAIPSPPAVQPENISSDSLPSAPPKSNYKHQFTLSGHTMSISALKFSPNGSVLASSGVSACPPYRYLPL